jgi:hypothetical protein
MLQVEIKLTLVHAMKAYWWSIKIQLYSFLTSVLDGGEWVNIMPGRFTPSTHSTAVGSLKGPGGFFKRKFSLHLQGFQPRIIQPAPLSLYQLSYPGSFFRK